MNNNKRYIEFEYVLRHLLMDLKDEVTKEDLFSLKNIKQDIIVFLMKDKFTETNEIFLDNTKNDFYNEIERLEENHTNIKSQTKIIKSFMEDFYF